MKGLMNSSISTPPKYDSMYEPWLQLISTIETYSEDIITSDDDDISKRYMKGGTLPAILRRLTSLETTSQSQIWTFLLHLRMFIGPKYILEYLMKRFMLTPKEVDMYAEKFRYETASFGIEEEKSNTSTRCPLCLGLTSNNALCACGYPSGGAERTATGADGGAGLTQSRHVIGPQFYWLSSPSELSQHTGDDTAQATLQLFSAERDEQKMMLESYASIKLAVLLFLETWLVHFSEDFVLAAVKLHGPASPGGASVAPSSASTLSESGQEDGQIMRELVGFMREVARSPMLPLLGVQIRRGERVEAPMSDDNEQYLPDIVIPPGSQFGTHFPCLARVLQVICEEDLAANQSQCDIDDAFEGNICCEDTCDWEDRDREDSNPYSRTASLRMSFFDRFGDSTLSEILEFEGDGDLESLQGSMQYYGMKKSPSKAGLIDQFLSSPLPREARLSMMHSEDDKFYLKVTLGDATCTCTISTALVSAMTAASIELRTKISQLRIPLPTGPSNVEEKESIVSALTSTDQPAEVHHGDEALHRSLPPQRITSGERKYSEDAGTDAALSNVPTLSVVLMSRLTQCLQVMRERSMNNLLREYTDSAVMLSAVELQLAQMYVMAESAVDVPVRLFAAPIDRHILSYKDSYQDGLDRVALLIRERNSSSDLHSAVDAALKLDDGRNKRRFEPSSSFSSSPSRPSLPHSPSTPTRASMFSWMRGSSSGAGGSRRRSFAGAGKVSTEKHTTSLFLDYSDKSIAENITMKFHYMFCCIPMLEFTIDYGFGSKSKSLTPMLSRLRSESERLQELIVNEILLHNDVMTRAEVIIQAIRVGELLARMRSHHAMMIVIFALQSHSVHRLRSSWAVVHARVPGRWDILQDLAGFGGQKLTANFCSRQAAEGVTGDIREEIFLSMPPTHAFPGFPTETSCVDSQETCSDGSSGTSTIISKYAGRKDFTDLRDSNSVIASMDGSRLAFRVIRFKESPSGEEDRGSSRTLDKTRARVLATSTSRSFVVVRGSEALANNGAKPEISSVLDNGSTEKPVDATQATQSRRINRVRSYSEGHVPVYRHHFDLDQEPSDGPPLLTPSILDESKSSIGADVDSSKSKSSNYRCRSKSHIITNKLILDSLGDDCRAAELQQPTQEEASSLEDLKTVESSDSMGEQSIISSLVQSTQRGLNRGGGSYRQHMCSRRSKRSIVGAVRSDKLGGAGGVPKESGKPCMPYINGIFARLIRLNEVPTFIRSTNDEEDGHQSHFLYANSPGNSPTDPRLLLINFGKLRSIANLLILVRSSQLTPYKMNIDFDIQCILGKNGPFRGDDAMWERSKALE